MDTKGKQGKTGKDQTITPWCTILDVRCSNEICQQTLVLNCTVCLRWTESPSFLQGFRSNTIQYMSLVWPFLVVARSTYCKRFGIQHGTLSKLSRGNSDAQRRTNQLSHHTYQPGQRCLGMEIRFCNLEGVSETWLGNLGLGSHIIVKVCGAVLKPRLQLLENRLWSFKPGFWNLWNSQHVN